MVSWDTGSSGSPGEVLANHREIWRGDQWRSSLRSTMWRNFGQVASLARFGRSARRQARRSAARARYLLGPPLWATSLETVEGARPSCAAIDRIDSPWARPLEISSRYSKLSERAACVP